jgi:hypothetical protein
LFGPPQVLRGTLPLTTVHDPVTGTKTGLGDLNMFDLSLFKEGDLEIGAGPQLTMPTATRDETGTGKWQAGAAVALIAAQKWGIFGTLVTWQH